MEWMYPQEKNTLNSPSGLPFFQGSENFHTYLLCADPQRVVLFKFYLEFMIANRGRVSLILSILQLLKLELSRDLYKRAWLRAW